MSSEKLAKTHPKVSKQWHPTKNGNLTPYDVTKGMRKKVWWKCPKSDDHEWEAMIYSKSAGGSKCPCCSGKKVSVTNRLDIKYPSLKKEWSEKNKGKISNITYASNKKAWWICEKKHEWEAKISNRTFLGR